MVWHDGHVKDLTLIQKKCYISSSYEDIHQNYSSSVQRNELEVLQADLNWTDYQTPEMLHALLHKKKGSHNFGINKKTKYSKLCLIGLIGMFEVIFIQNEPWVSQHGVYAAVKDYLHSTANNSYFLYMFH